MNLKASDYIQAYLDGTLSYDNLCKVLDKLDSDDHARRGGGCSECFEGCDKCQPGKKNATSTERG